MAGKVRHLIERAGRYHARIVVPVALKSIVGKTELTTPLGSDRPAALRKLPAAVAAIQDRLDAARARLRQESTRTKPLRHRRLDADEMARTHYAQAVAADMEFRNADSRYASFGFVDEDQVRSLRAIIAGSASEDEIATAIGAPLEYFRRRGNHDHIVGSPEWRALARALARAELESLNVQAVRDEGENEPETPLYLVPQTTETIAGSDHRVREVFDGYRAELEGAGRGKNAARKWNPVIDNLVTFLGHDRAKRISRHDAIRWKDALLKTFSPKTARDHYIATARAAFGWAVDNDQLPSNPFERVRVIMKRTQLLREKGYNDEEALAVLKAAKAYAPSSKKEKAPMIAAKRWTPFLAAYTGARIGELTQLRAEDVHTSNGVLFIRITPAAGTVKTDAYRDVPLHKHLIDIGFMDFVRAVKAGPLFYRSGERRGKDHPSLMVADRVGKWIRKLNVSDASVQPNHGWRHRVKTQGRDLGIDPRVVDAIQGHAPRTAGEGYGDVSLGAKKAAIERLPAYPV